MKAKLISLTFQTDVELKKSLTNKSKSSWEFVIFVKIKRETHSEKCYVLCLSDAILTEIKVLIFLQETAMNWSKRVVERMKEIEFFFPLIQKEGCHEFKLQFYFYPCEHSKSRYQFSEIMICLFNILSASFQFSFVKKSGLRVKIFLLKKKT